jgi:hypothetical protein
MTIQSSGPISLVDIQTEFGGSNPIGINEYYSGGGIVASGVKNVSGVPVPSSGEISLSNFYGTASTIPGISGWKAYQIPGVVANSNTLAGTNGSYYLYVSGIKVFKSTDGASWTQSGTLPLATNMTEGNTVQHGIAWGNGKWLIVGGTTFGLAAFYPVVWSSSDGVTWTNITSNLTNSGFPNSGKNYVENICFNGNSFFVCCNSSMYGATSTDGVTWSLTSSLRTAWGVTAAGNPVAIGELFAATAPGTGRNAGIRWNGSYYMAVGYSETKLTASTFTSAYPVCATSTDGVTWTNRPALRNAVTAAGYLGYPSLLCWNGSVWYIYGKFGGSTGHSFAEITSSDNGATFSSITLIGTDVNPGATTRGYMSTIVATDTGVMTMAGEHTTAPANPVLEQAFYSTNNGTTWTSLDSAFINAKTTGGVTVPDGYLFVQSTFANKTVMIFSYSGAVLISK